VTITGKETSIGLSTDSTLVKPPNGMRPVIDTPHGAITQKGNY